MIVGSRFSRHKAVKAVRPLYFRCSFLSDYLFIAHIMNHLFLDIFGTTILVIVVFVWVS